MASPFPFPSRRPVRRAFAHLVAAASAAVLITAAPAGAVEFEQVNRGDGVAGASPIEYTQMGSNIVSPDGATVYFVLEYAEGAWSKAPGLYRRDVATNRTTLIAAGGDVRITSLSA